jgi:hypothetical protein
MAVHKLIAVGCIAISAALAGLYGYMTADTQIYGAIRASSLFAVAVIGGCCPAWASYHWHARRYGQSLFTFLVCVVCLAVTLGGGMGTIAGGADKSTAERTKVSNAANFNRAELERITAELKKLPEHRPAGTVTADIEAAKAGRLYKSSGGCELERINSKAVREACETFHKLEAELATAKTADQLEGKVARLGAALKEAPAVQSANPQAMVIANLLRIPIDDAVAWYAFVASLALELAGMAAMMRADASTSPPRKPEPVTVPIAKVTEPVNITELEPVKMIEPVHTVEPIKIAPPKPQLVASVDTKAGSVPDILVGLLEPASGQRVEIADIYKEYAQACQAAGARALSAEQFIEPAQRFCRECRIRTQQIDEHIYLIDVQIAGTVAKRRKRDTLKRKA